MTSSYSFSDKFISIFEYQGLFCQ